MRKMRMVLLVVVAVLGLSGAVDGLEGDYYNNFWGFSGSQVSHAVRVRDSQTGAYFHGVVSISNEGEHDITVRCVLLGKPKTYVPKLFIVPAGKPLNEFALADCVYVYTADTTDTCLVYIGGPKENYCDAQGRP